MPLFLHIDYEYQYGILLKIYFLAKWGINLALT